MNNFITVKSIVIIGACETTLHHIPQERPSRHAHLHNNNKYRRICWI